MNNKFKRLAIISDCVHAFDESGNAVTENHIFCRQIQSLSAMFKYTVICCPFVPYSSKMVVTPYTDGNIDFIPLPNPGGNALKDKIALLKTLPAWLKAFEKVNSMVDIVYQRFPNNLNIPGFFYFRFKRKRTFASYTGTWKNYKGEPFTYRLQKWLLKYHFKGPVWAYMHDDTEGDHIFKNFSPSYTLKEWNEETKQVSERIKRLCEMGLNEPVFITVGSLVPNKNQHYILNAFKILHDQDFKFHLYIVGDGPLKDEYYQFVYANGLQKAITFTGKKRYQELRTLYRQSDFLVQATLVEGFGKTPVEGFFHGVIPLLNNTALAKEMTGESERGFIFSCKETNNLVRLINEVMSSTNILPGIIQQGRSYARQMTLENWAHSYIRKINE